MCPSRGMLHDSRVEQHVTSIGTTDGTQVTRETYLEYKCDN